MKLTDHLLYISIIIALIAAIIVLIPSSISPVHWDEPNPLRALTGELTPNNILRETEMINDGKLRGPESAAFDTDSGIAYIGMGDGTVGQFFANGSIESRLLFIGGYIQEMKETNQSNSNGLSFSTMELLKYCALKSIKGELAWDLVTERSCGRPLGMRLIKFTNGEKILYFLDAYYGLFSYNTKSSKLEHLVDPQTKIESPASPFDEVVLKPPKFYNDLDVTKDGDVIFTDSSYRNTRSEFIQEVVDGAPRGRLFKYNLKSKKLEVILCGLHFPNGVQLMPTTAKNQDPIVLVVELTRFRVLKVNLTSSFLYGQSISFNATNSMHSLTSCDEKGSTYHMLKSSPSPSFDVSIYLDSVPGIPDNIRMDATSPPESPRYLIGLQSKSTEPFSFLWFCYQHIYVTKTIERLVPFRFWEMFVPQYGFVLITNNDGDILKSLQDPTGKISKVSQANVNPVTKDIWLGSHSNSYLGILPANVTADMW